MPPKSYKQLYEETKYMLGKYQDEIVPKLREQLEAQSQSKPLTEEELLALRTVVHGCNTNPTLTMASRHNGIRYANAIVTVCDLIERLS